jgi:putative transcriptional regulator
MPKKANQSPTVEAIRRARAVAQLTQEAAAERIHGKRRTWEDWESGRAKMHPGLFELFLIKTGQPTNR